jgi:hypothetical protein
MTDDRLDASNYELAAPSSVREENIVNGTGLDSWRSSVWFGRITRDHRDVGQTYDRLPAFPCHEPRSIAGDRLHSSDRAHIVGKFRVSTVLER